MVAACGTKVHFIKDLKDLEKGDVVLFSFNSIEALELPELLKFLPAGVVKIAGGPHASALPQHLLSFGFDYVVAGEGEEVIKPLLDFIEKRGELPQCVWTRDRSGSFCRGVEIDRYPPFSLNPRLIIPIEITRGCPFGCTYCQTPRIFGRKVRHRSVETILHWLGKAAESGIRDFRFVSPNALSYGSKNGVAPEKGEIYRLLSEIKKQFPHCRIYFGSFPSEVRPEFVDEEIARMLKEFVSNKRIVIGAQSADDDTLRRLRRGHTFEDVVRACEILLRFGFEPHVDFIFGLPLADEGKNLKGMELLSKMGAKIHAHYFMPLPGTPLATAEPVSLDEAFIKTVERLTGEGKLYGQWKRQREISKALLDLNRRFAKI